MKFGGRPGVLSEPGLRSALARPYSGYHRQIERKCAALLHAIVRNHPFVDGNKRTAWYLTAILIERSGYQLLARQDERIDDVIVSVAEGLVEFDDLVIWLSGLRNG